MAEVLSKENVQDNKMHRYFEMEKFEALSTVLKTVPEKDKWQFVVNLLCQLLEAASMLQDIDTPIVHADLTKENILWDLKDWIVGMEASALNHDDAEEYSAKSQLKCSHANQQYRENFHLNGPCFLFFLFL